MAIQCVQGGPAVQIGVPANLAINTFTGGSLTGELGVFQFLYQAGRFTIVDDPTGSGRGKVGQFFYFPIQSNPSDDEVINPRNSVPSTVPTFRYGYTLWATCDYYFPSANSSGIARNQNGRKFLDYKGNGTRMTLHKRRDDVNGNATTSENPANSHSAVHLSIVRNGVETSDSYCGFGLNDDTWYNFKVRMTTNTANGTTDGVVDIYLNGAATPTFSKTGINWFNDTDTNTFNFLMVGSQLTCSSSDLFSEYRYIDNVKFSTQDITA